MNQKIFKAVRQGLVFAMPITMIGAFVTVFMSLPVPAYQEFIRNFAGGYFVVICRYILQATFGMYSLVLVCTVSYSYGKLYKGELSNAYVVMVVSLISFLILSLSGIREQKDITVLFGMDGIFSAVMIALVSSWLFRKAFSIRRFRLERSMYGINSAVQDSVSYIIPCTVVLAAAAVINCLSENMLHAGSVHRLLTDSVSLLFRGMSGNLFSTLLFVLMVHIFWFFGIHGSHVMTQVGFALFVEGISIHAISTVASGTPAVALSHTFINTYALMGGCGATLCLAAGIALFSKQRSMHGLNKVSLTATFFNINEMLLFGVPVAANPVFLIPFLAVPLLSLLTACAASALGLVPPVVHEVQWTVPVLFSGYMAIGSIRASLLQLFNLGMGVAIYRPFIRKNDQRIEESIKSGILHLQQELQEFEKLGKPSDFLSRNDETGDMAKMLCRDLSYAMEHNELELFYQPQMTSDNRCMGVEALLRWKHKTAGYIYPPLVIALAKEAKLLYRLEEFIFNQACCDLRYIHDHISGEMKMSVNITGYSLLNENLEGMIDQAVERYAVDSTKLWIEITEQDAIALTEEISSRLLALKNKGHCLLIDDFGMGHTSLLYLQTNKFDVVKLDGSITEDVLNNNRSCQIISSISYLAQSMEFHIIAEYVETEEQRQKLQELNCNAFQGYLYSKPVRIEAFEQWYHEVSA